MKAKRKFIKLKDVKKGDLLLNYDGTEEEVESIEFISSIDDVYNIEVSGNHNYYAEGVLVHNKSWLLDWGGSYRGDDKEAAAAIKRDNRSYEAMINALGLINEEASSMQEAYEKAIESGKNIYEADSLARSSAHRSRMGQMESAAGKTGLATSSVDPVIGTAKEDYMTNLSGFRLKHGQQELQERTALEKNLFRQAERGTDLYGSFIQNQATTAHHYKGTSPEYNTQYAGGYQWKMPTYTDPSTMGKWGLGKCFLADTKIDGKDISKIKEGDMVASYNIETGIIEKKEVIETFKHKNDRGYLVINGRIKATGNHPFYIRRGNNG
jgi:hypothetical protein